MGGVVRRVVVLGAAGGATCRVKDDLSSLTEGDLETYCTAGREGMVGTWIEDEDRVVKDEDRVVKGENRVVHIEDMMEDKVVRVRMGR